eukprot:CAMPEP_0197587006 /NCGR_PEP_ID=MMETSP1326-20131121/8784_1 /TAXON_ID=1155430 /ORGANISM="Genus nov. species nov., Strain RCC2288" /LENGTH=100 /DNA_ID=CAMNT_0043151691 /DNA_START=471 /DNA_END=769 /DNA_ORIENTATION=+
MANADDNKVQSPEDINKAVGDPPAPPAAGDIHVVVVKEQAEDSKPLQAPRFKLLASNKYFFGGLCCLVFTSVVIVIPTVLLWPSSSSSPASPAPPPPPSP